MAPSGHTNAYDNGYSKGYHDGWNKASGSGGRSNQQSTPNGTSSIDGVPNGQQVPNNNSAVCDPTYQFCAMTIPISENTELRITRFYRKQDWNIAFDSGECWNCRNVCVLQTLCCNSQDCCFVY